MAEEGLSESSHLIKANAFDMDKVPCTEMKEGLDSTDDEVGRTYLLDWSGNFTT